MELILSALPSIMLAYLIHKLERMEAKVNDLKCNISVIESYLWQSDQNDDDD